jgi:hypothetical protein
MRNDDTMIRKLWTDEKPKQSGYYWLKRDDPRPNAEVVYVTRGRVYSTRGKGGFEIENVAVKDTEGKWHGPVPFPSLHRANKYEQGLKDLTLVVLDCLTVLEAVMTAKESPERGSKVAKIANALEFANDRAMHFSLDMSFEQMDTLKRKRARMLKRGNAPTNT